MGWEDPLEEDLETHSSLLAWRIPWTEEPGGLQSMGSQKIGHGCSDLACTFEMPLRPFQGTLGSQEIPFESPYFYPQPPRGDGEEAQGSPRQVKVTRGVGGRGKAVVAWP